VTDYRCHLCHKPVDLEHYGPPGLYGDETVTVDHDWPQAFGGDDDPDNLLLAHACCNSYRGTRDVEEVREELAGTARAPLGTLERGAVVLTAGGIAYTIAARACAKRAEDGSLRLNHGAGTLCGALAALAVYGLT
jgi:hypothetical protein